MYGLDDLVLFTKVVEIGSFSNTAKALKVTSQAVANRIRNMESRMGVVLIHATTREFKLTEAGQLLYGILQESSGCVDKMLRNTEEFVKDKHEPQGTIRIVMNAMLPLHLITPYLHQFSIKYPKIDLNIRFINAPVDLIREGYDMALGNFIPSQQDLKIKNVFNTKWKLFCSKGYADKYGLPATPAELIANHKIVGIMNLDGRPVAHFQMTNTHTGESILYKMPKHLTINNQIHILPLIKSNEFICPGSEEMNPDLKAEDIVTVLPDYYVLEMKFYLIFHPHARDLKIKLFSDFLERCLIKEL